MRKYEACSLLLKTILNGMSSQQIHAQPSPLEETARLPLARFEAAERARSCTHQSILIRLAISAPQKTCMPPDFACENENYLKRQHARQGGLVTDLEDPVRPAMFAEKIPLAVIVERVLNHRRMITSVDAQLASPDRVLALAKQRISAVDVEKLASWKPRIHTCMF